jgi:hypothetical protein
MNRKKVFMGIIIIGIVIIGIIIVYVLLLGNRSSMVQEINVENREEDVLISTNTAIDNITEGSGDLRFRALGSMPTNLRNKLPDSRSSEFIDYFYSEEFGIALSYEIRASINSEEYFMITPSDFATNSGTIYLHIVDSPKESGQSIEVINIDPNLRFNTIPEIITQQILIADEKVGCKVEEKNGRYSIKPKNSTQTCGNYADINNKFFVKPTEDGSAISKLIFVNAGNQELSYDGSMKGKYWYESVIVE